MTYDINILRQPDPDCDAFVAQHKRARICHLWAWGNMVEVTFGHKNMYLVARRGNRIKGVMPLIQVRSRLFGNHIISPAFHEVGGVLTDESEVCNALFNFAVELAIEKKCDFIEFRNIDPLQQNLTLRTDKMTFHLPLPSDPEDLWQGFRSEIRNRIRKAQKSGLETRQGGVELLNDYYRAWTIRMHQLGTPCFPKKLMRSVLETFPDNSRLFLVFDGDMTVGGGLTTSFNGWVDMQWVATLREYNRQAANNLLYWSVIQQACRDRARWFDFGRCTVDGPTYVFKKRWGPEAVPYHYQYWARPDYTLSLLSPNNPKFKRKIAMWKRLPLWATRLLGPFISRNLP